MIRKLVVTGTLALTVAGGSALVLAPAADASSPSVTDSVCLIARAELVPDRTAWDRLIDAGWRGDPSDGVEALYSPACHVGVVVQTAAAEDGSTVRPGFYDKLGEGIVRKPDGSLGWAPGYGPNGQKPGYVQTEDGSWVPPSYYGN